MLVALLAAVCVLTFRFVFVFACSLISYSPVTRTSLWISSRKHFLELTGKKKEMENTDSKRTGNSSSASRAMANCQPTDQPDRASPPAFSKLQLRQPVKHTAIAPHLVWRVNCSFNRALNRTFRALGVS